MTQDLESLIKLQDIDLKIIEQIVAKEQYPATVANLGRRIAAAESACGAAKAKLEHFSGSVADADAQIEKLRENLTRSQERLNNIQTNKEYDAVHAEIETQKNMLDTAENKKTNLEANIEKHKIALERAEEEYNKIKEEQQPEIDSLNAKIGAIDSVIDSLTKEREQVVAGMTQHTRRAYDSIRKKRKDGKVVSIVNESKTCEMCSMLLRPQLYVEICRGNDFILCESCGSMLVRGE